jgi:hypothetical protein
MDDLATSTPLASSWLRAAAMSDTQSCNRADDFGTSSTTSGPMVTEQPEPGGVS